MKALILNSGIGHRMGTLTQHQPKCMTSIGAGYSILSRQLTQLAGLGIEEVVITTGPFAAALQEHVTGLHLAMPVRYIHNADYAETNYIVSMDKAADLLLGHDVLLLHGDLVLETGVLVDLMQSNASVMAVDDTLPLPPKDFKALVKDGQIIAVGVELFGEDCVACQPAYRWLAQDLAAWLHAVAQFVARGETKVYAENAFNAQQGGIPLRPLQLCGRLCNEIDNPQDLAEVSARFAASLLKEAERP